jgi:hypothetical protein
MSPGIDVQQEEYCVGWWCNAMHISGILLDVYNLAISTTAGTHSVTDPSHRWSCTIHFQSCFHFRLPAVSRSEMCVYFLYMKWAHCGEVQPPYLHIIPLEFHTAGLQKNSLVFCVGTILPLFYIKLKSN